MTTDEILDTLRRKERSRKPAGWKTCKQAADLIDQLQAEKDAEKAKKHYLHCPHCGGRLSEPMDGYRHCYSCHFEYEVIP